MSVRNKSLLFIAVTFAVSWAIVIGGWAAGLHENQQLAVLVIALSMFGPAVAAITCAVLFEKGRRVEALGLRAKINWWWLLAWLIPIALAALAVGLTLMFSANSFVPLGKAVIAAAPAEQAASLNQLGPDALGAIVLAQALLIGPLINTLILTFSEELGWRGYLWDLWNKIGFWRASLATGAIWGVWHAPAILLFGHNYPHDRLIGAPLFVLFCVLLSPIISHLRAKGGSVWVAGVFHGTFNAVAGLTVISLSAPAFPWNGMVGIGGFLALAAGLGLVALTRRRAA